MTALRPYQVEVIAEFERTVAAGQRRIILVAPTGAGKTVIAADIIKAATSAFKFVLVVSHRREIIAQTSAKLHGFGISHGIIRAGFPPRPMESVQVASVQTLHARAIRTNRMQLPPAHLVVIDECHHCPAKSYRKIVDAYPDATLLGLTATPCRGDGRGLGGIFETIIECPQVAELIEQGYLVKTRVYAPVNPDLVGVRVQAGDYVLSSPTGWIFQNWSAMLLPIGTNTASDAEQCALPSTSRIRSTFAMSSSSPACEPNISTAALRSRSAMPPLPDWHPAKPS
jgi:superfamily II DNA or RNA helicase